MHFCKICKNDKVRLCVFAKFVKMMAYDRSFLQTFDLDVTFTVTFTEKYGSSSI